MSEGNSQLTRPKTVTKLLSPVENVEVPFNVWVFVANEIITRCKTPPLHKDLDDSILAEDYRHISHNSLQLNLYKLYRVIEAKKELLNISISRHPDLPDALGSFHFRLRLLLYEQNEGLPSYQCNMKKLLKAFNDLAFLRFAVLRPQIVLTLHEWYKMIFSCDDWHRELAIVRGFRAFCEDYLETNVEQRRVAQIFQSGFQLLQYEHHEHYNLLGLRVYEAIMELCDKNFLRLHKYADKVYDDCFQMIGKYRSIDFNGVLSEGLIACVRSRYEAGQEDPEENGFDEVLAVLLVQFEAAGDTELSDTFLEKIATLCFVPHKFILDEMRNYEAYFRALKGICKNRNMLTPKWNKELTQMIIRELPRLQGEVGRLFLTCVHCIYIACFWSTDYDELGADFALFIDTFVPAMESMCDKCTAADANAITFISKTIIGHQTNEAMAKRLFALLVRSLTIATFRR